ncbi:peroxiredoxin [Acidiferrobacter sp.]|uniref:peroxiredoxin n=1 Tax=Acidiferrobacter sp. TaxID=1872107 RepID=UPI0026119A18|nr:peroxiredoxin [Acidiferrobacter sp.]
MSLHLGDTAPDFTQDSTMGPIEFHKWLGNHWAVLFSHPADYTPVCTTELGSVARLMEDFKRRDVKVLAVSVDPVTAHKEWIKDIDETQRTHVEFPILGDQDRKVSTLYDMIHPRQSDTLTVRSVFIIDPKKTIRTILTYPASTGRDFGEIFRVIDSLQLTDKYAVATPANWRSGDDVVISPALKDKAALKAQFPKGYKEIRPYLRMTPQPGP